jgi:signal transduction histidine kinase
MREVRRLAEFNVLLGHELRSCLNSVLLSAEVLAFPDVSDSVCQKQIECIRSAVAHAEELLCGADAMMRPPAAQVLPVVTLQALFEAVKRETEGRAHAAGVTLTFQDLLPRRSVDAAVSRLALSNLVVNAIKYADSAKPDRWATVQIVQTGQADPDLLVMEVADNGLGIPARLQRHILKPGFRAHPQIAEGAGLGLALTREHLMNQGGSIDIVSEERVGTKARITLRGRPVECVADDGTSRQTAYP